MLEALNLLSLSLESISEILSQSVIREWQEGSRHGRGCCYELLRILSMRAQIQAPPRLHHYQLPQNPIVLPPSQQLSIMHPPNVAVAEMSSATIQHHHHLQQPQPPLPYDPYYHHYQQQFQQQHQSLGYNNQVGQEMQHIQTLFVSGLPDDVKPREIHNLFRRRPGFESCQLKYTGRGNQVVAFASFFNHELAMGALSALNGVPFDPQTGATLHIELARSNSRKKRPAGSGAYVVIDKRLKATSDAQDTWSNDGDGGSDEPSGELHSSNKGDLATAESGETRVDPDNAGAAANEQSEKTYTGEVQPCSTLFIANLGPNCTEEELKQVLTQYPGYHVLKMRAKGGMPVAFADFEDTERATEAMESLQGSMLPSSDRGGLHIEYARSKMRKA
ncbi:U1 small nuclear ribonucleoprotein A-like isoform X2 [Macadamia integrifolia]|uniref:U1 small nuclear ribonucleoprotein A-like isoform X2 n=1 Tax=Macadamia integrifolia TaxID=60698 RepID=UPI001C4FCCC7|nr:U1 small nuclear ribonucleoprotein A-like isoform X2 [Macadamia integrifolia]